MVINHRRAAGRLFLAEGVFAEVVFPLSVNTTQWDVEVICVLICRQYIDGQTPVLDKLPNFQELIFQNFEEERLSNITFSFSVAVILNINANLPFALLGVIPVIFTGSQYPLTCCKLQTMHSKINPISIVIQRDN